jgi:hypothetical protein
LLLGHQILLGQRFISVEIQMRSDLIGLGALQVRLRCRNVLFAITIFLQLVIRLRLGRRRSRFRNFLWSIASPGLFRRRLGLVINT